MYQDVFLPVVFDVRLSSDQALPTSKWQLLIHDMLHRYIGQICENENWLIGHIKALALIDDTNFIKYSCSSDTGKIDSKFNGSHKDISKINIIINSLVANLSESESRVILERACETLENREGKIDIQIDAQKKESEMHHHHHHEGENCPICNGHHH